ncbi:MAG: putative glycoside hydrolase [Firmicutes bacterium]|nr:putative glycoside hydrolase [Bacillota bacterium]
MTQVDSARHPGQAGRPSALLKAARGIVARRPAVLAVLALTVLVAGLVPGPLSALESGYGGPGEDPSPRQVTADVLAASHPWPEWAVRSTAGDGTGPGTGRSPGTTSGRGLGTSAALSRGYRGWPHEPPPAILARLAPGEDEPSPLHDEVRGIYLTAYTAGQPAALRALLELVDSTALNAMVINIKDEAGRATYDTKVEAFREAGAVSVQIHDVQGLLRLLKAYGVYVIGRLVTFEDSTLPLHRPDLAVRRRDGSLWRDRAGNAWLDPFRQENWDYVLALAEEAAGLGFDEIQFDYVRFPTDGDVAAAVFSQDSGPNNINRVRAITDFLHYARARLAPYGCLVSADVFGIICSTAADTALGQVLEDIAPAVDYISPMIYPSHYGSGHFGLADPDAEPYLTIRGALSDALERLGPGGAAKLRPWLQDFTLYNPYGPEEVLDQIRATHELGIKGWLLWSPSNVYTVAALRAYTVNLEAYLAGEG